MIDLADPNTDVKKLYKEFKKYLIKNDGWAYCWYNFMPEEIHRFLKNKYSITITCNCNLLLKIWYRAGFLKRSECGKMYRCI